MSILNIYIYIYCRFCPIFLHIFRFSKVRPGTGNHTQTTNMANQEGVLMPVEAEAWIECLESYDISEIGGKRWNDQHEKIEKLNIQSVLSASLNEEEFVKEFLLTFNKLPVLVGDLLVNEIWKDKVFSEVIKLGLNPDISFPIYIILYHEAVVANLLETVLFHRDCCESIEPVVLDLIDYCHRKIITHLQSGDFKTENKVSVEDIEYPDCTEELRKQNESLEFDILVKSVSIVHYIIDHIDSLPLSVVNRVLDTYDTPVVFLNLIINPPWVQRKDNKIMKYIDGKWQTFKYSQTLAMTKTEGQVWMTMFQLLMHPSCQQKYELNDYRKNMLLKLRSHITETLLDQIPALSDLRRYLEHLSFIEPAAVKKTLILEQTANIHENIIKENEGKWQLIAKNLIKSFLSSGEDIKEQAKRWAETYSTSAVEELMSEPSKCANCLDFAAKQCSRCKSEWYCGRECQVKHWPKHKSACALMQDTVNKLQKSNIE